jgi:hypothetical protein
VLSSSDSFLQIAVAVEDDSEGEIDRGAEKFHQGHRQTFGTIAKPNALIDVR